MKKELVSIECQHERLHKLWEITDLSLTKSDNCHTPIEWKQSKETLHSLQSSPFTCIDKIGQEKSLTHYNRPESPPYSSVTPKSPVSRALFKKLKLGRKNASNSTLESLSTCTFASCTNVSTAESVLSKYQPTKNFDPTNLNDEEWFHGALPRDESNQLLMVKGDFLVRESNRDGKRCVVVSVMWEGCRHYIIDITQNVS